MGHTTAVVVAGGRSARFGDREKALVPIDGRPMLRRVADRVAPLADELVVNCRPDQRAAFAETLAGHEPRFAVDPVPDRGPVAGLRTGLRVAAGRHAVALACDLPFLDPTLLDRLRDRVTDGAAAAVPTVDGRPQPLAAVYDVRAAREACTRVLDRGDDRLQAVLADLDPIVTADEDTVRECAAPGSLTNVNTPADLRRTVPADSRA